MGVLFELTDPQFPILFKNCQYHNQDFFSNLKENIEKEKVSKFGSNGNYIIDDMYLKYKTIIDKGEFHEGYICHLLIYLFTGKNQPLTSS